MTLDTSGQTATITTGTSPRHFQKWATSLQSMSRIKTDGASQSLCEVLSSVTCAMLKHSLCSVNHRLSGAVQFHLGRGEVSRHGKSRPGCEPLAQVLGRMRTSVHNYPQDLVPQPMRHVRHRMQLDAPPASNNTLEATRRRWLVSFLPRNKY